MKISISFWQLALASIVVLMLFPSPAEASKGCWCWIGIERGERLIDYGSVDRYRDTEFDKKRKCSEACSKRCASDLANHSLLCSKLGGDYVHRNKIGCFSVVGARDNDNNTWDYDGRPANFKGCSSCCTCAKGWYDKARKSCVTGTDCKAPGLPDGEKGGGYFAWREKLFKKVPGADCTVKVGVDACGSGSSAKWTPWYDVDDPGSSGDWETLQALRQRGLACDKPQDIQCQTLAGQDWKQAGETYTCSKDKGGICRNADQDDRRCQDYRVRFLCPG